jgi:hypothetical protein
MAMKIRMGMVIKIGMGMGMKIGMGMGMGSQSPLCARPRRTKGHPRPRAVDTEPTSLAQFARLPVVVAAASAAGDRLCSLADAHEPSARSRGAM